MVFDKKSYMEKYRELHKEEIRLYNVANCKKYYQDHKKELLLGQKEYRGAHKDKLKNRRREYYIKNKDRMNKNSREYYLTHKEEMNNFSKEYRITHKEEIQKWIETNKEQIRNTTAEYWQKHKQRLNLLNKEWRENHKNEMNELNKKHHNKRRRELGFCPLNTCFDKSNAHHLDKNNVIYIPDELHKSVPHRQNNEESMKQINILAWNFMESGVY